VLDKNVFRELLQDILVMSLNYEKDFQVYKKSLNIYTKEEFPEIYQRIEENIKKCL